MRRAGGFTLIEIMVSVAILAIVIAGISNVLIAQSRATVNQTLQRDLEESGRLALNEMARSVRLAGYGVSPIAAFDFDRFACTSPGTASTCPNGGRDRSDGPDEIVVASRNLSFSRTIASVSTGGAPYSVTVGTELGKPLSAGQMMFLLCSSATKASYVALDANAAATTKTFTVRLATDADGYFNLDPNALSAPTSGCFNDGSARAYLIDRVRYYVANDTDGVPSLFKDRGSGGEKLYRGIEDLQLTYEIGAPPAGSSYAAGGASAATPPACSGTSWIFGECGTNVATPVWSSSTAPKWMDDPYDTPNRYTGNPTNIRVVAMTVVARALRHSPDGTGDAVVQIANRPARAADGYRRAVLSATIATPNLLTRAYFVAQATGGG